MVDTPQPETVALDKTVIEELTDFIDSLPDAVIMGLLAARDAAPGFTDSDTLRYEAAYAHLGDLDPADAHDAACFCLDAGKLIAEVRARRQAQGRGQGK